MASSERRKKGRNPEEQAPNIRRARARLAGGDARGALKAIEEHLKNLPDDATALFEKSRILYELGDRPASLDSKLQALVLKKASTEVAAIGDMLMEDNLFMEAETILRARLDEDDSQFTTRFTLAKLLLLSGRFIEASKEIQKLYRESKRTPIVRADFLEALRYALLGDIKNLAALLTRLRANRVPEYRLAFFNTLHSFVAGGDPEIFSAEMKNLRQTARAQPLYASLYKMITPDIFLGAENKLRREFRRVLGDRLKGPRLSGLTLNPEETTIFNEIFSRYTAVTFTPIDEESSGFSGDKVFRAHVELKGFVENSCLIKSGPKYRIAIEKEKIGSFVVGKLHPNFHPQILGYSHGRTMAAMRFSWASIDDELPFSLRKLFINPSYGVEDLDQTLTKLMKTVMAGWYLRNTRRRTMRLYKHLDQYASMLEDYVGDRDDLDDPVMILSKLGLTVPNPIQRIRKLSREREADKTTIPFGIHHGDLNSRNVLLDGAFNICLIDFYKTDLGFSLLDAARMEADLRYEVEPPRDYLQEIRWMDSRLASAQSLLEIKALDVRRSMEKRHHAALRIRALAAEVFELDEKEMLHLYGIAMLISLIRMLKYGHLSPLTTELLLAELSDILHFLSEGD